MKLKYTICNICGNKNTRFIGYRIGPRDSIAIVKCNYCGLLYPNPMPELDDAEIQTNFSNADEYFNRPITVSRIKKWENIVRDIEKFKPTKGRLLDIGCGRGELIYAAKKRNWHVMGTEISRSFAQYAKDKFNFEILIGDIKNLKISNDKFDVICLSSVIQYMKDPLGELKKIYTLLQKDGILYIEVTNEDALVFKVADLFKSFISGRKITTHLSPTFPSFQIYGFNKSSLITALENAGFKTFYFRIKGIVGGGQIKEDNFVKRGLNFIRKIVIALGGLTGKGHLIFCFAKRACDI